MFSKHHPWVLASAPPSLAGNLLEMQKEHTELSKSALKIVQCVGVCSTCSELPSCPSYFSIARTKHHDLKPSGDVIWLTYTEPQSIKGNWGKNSKQARTWRHELLQMSLKSVAYWIAPCGLQGLLSYSNQDHQPRGGTTPSSITNLENNLKLANIPVFSPNIIFLLIIF